ncbi:DUF2236 domain-containing protein [Acidobacteria bacterium AB60]|nr:DUF2236 domain-containing protein [Acidobacteria bacterium AB60]
MAAELKRVTRTESDGLIDALARRAGNPRAGIFGPESITWRVNRESALFLGAGRAALLQLAHPWVATALEQHSSLMERPIERFHNTFRIVFTMIFGSLGQATRAARHLYGLHTHIQGELTEGAGRHAAGSHYEANEIDALRWVYATLVESAVMAYHCALPPLHPKELGVYYEESRTLAMLFGLPPGSLPREWESFVGYCREMERSDELGVTGTARRMGERLLGGAGSWVRPPGWYRSLTAEWLPERFREEFALRYGPEEQRSAGRAMARIPGVYRRLPGVIRFSGPWHEAQARLAGWSPGGWVKLLNRFWIGQYRMPFLDENAPIGG